jgi:glycosyltransferase involved in cell wall biosynthesis
MSYPSVLVIQRILPPYRLRFFQRLSASDRLSIRVAHGLSTGASALKSLENPSGVAIERLRNIFPFKEDRVVIQRNLFPLLWRGNFEVIIAEFNPRIVTNLVACLMVKLRGRKFIWWGHGASPKSGWLSMHLRLFFARMADAMIFYDERGAARFIEQGVQSEKVFVATNSIDTEEIVQLVERRPLSERHCLLFIGRLLAGKKVDILIRAFARARGKLRPNTQLTIIGSGPDLNRLTRLVAELNLTEEVQFVPAIYEQSQLAPYFNAAWISVSPGWIGLSAIHSLAYGVPMLVARDEPHRPEVNALEENVNSIFFNSDDIEDLARHLLWLDSSAERHAQMSDAGFNKIHKQFSLQAMVDAFERAVSYTQGGR